MTTTTDRPRTAQPNAAHPDRLEIDPGVLDVVEAAEPVGIPSASGLLRGFAGVLLQPRPVAREFGRVARDLGRIVRGTDLLQPGPKDKRFADPAWTDNPLYRRLGQSYIASADALNRLVDELERGGADWHDVERARFVVNALTSALAPTNALAGNPAALKRAFETGGRSVLRGLGHLITDLRVNGGMPAQTDRSAFTVGVDLAITPGAVVYRGEVLEILQYTPTTPQVQERPLVVIPPPIGRFYFLDLRPGRSFVEYAVSQGLQVFVLSWRNPTAEQAGWDLDTYAEAIDQAFQVVKAITGSDDVNALGFCAGGILQTTVLNHYAATGDTTVHSASYGVTLLDFGVRAPIGAFSSPPLLSLAGRLSRRKGVITARSMGAVFTWMRPDDLVFNYVVNNWLLGNEPPAFDILAWNVDGTNLPARLHEQFLEIFRDNSLCQPGAVTVLGSPVDLAQITVPIFVTGGVTDHLTPWKGCYVTTTALSGPSTFVLSNAGHIASLVNPPGNAKASYHEGGPDKADPEAWLAGATQRTGSWWEVWAKWALDRSGELRPAPDQLGSALFPVLEAAPGSYVLDRQPAAV